MILMGANQFWGPMERVGPEIRDFYESWKGNEQSKCHLSPRKLRFSGPTPSNGPNNGFAPIKIVKFKCHKKKKWYVGNFIYMRFAAVVFCIVYCMLWVLCVFFHQDKMNSLCLASHPNLPHQDIVNSLRPGKGWRDRVGGLSLPAPHPPPSPFVQNNLEINGNI